MPVDNQTIRFFVQYVCIGGLVLCVDLGTFTALLKARVILAVALTIAFVLSAASHFLLNRFLNFRNFDRAIHKQLRTFATILFFSWLVTLTVTEIGYRAFSLPPLGAKLCAVLVNLPIGFLAHRYLTFGAGITSAVRGVYSRLKERNRREVAKHG